MPTWLHISECRILGPCPCVLQVFLELTKLKPEADVAKAAVKPEVVKADEGLTAASTKLYEALLSSGKLGVAEGKVCTFLL